MKEQQKKEIPSKKPILSHLVKAAEAALERLEVFFANEGKEEDSESCEKARQMLLIEKKRLPRETDMESLAPVVKSLTFLVCQAIFCEEIVEETPEETHLPEPENVRGEKKWNEVKEVLRKELFRRWKSLKTGSLWFHRYCSWKADLDEVAEKMGFTPERLKSFIRQESEPTALERKEMEKWIGPRGEIYMASQLGMPEGENRILLVATAMSVITEAHPDTHSRDPLYKVFIEEE